MEVIFRRIEQRLPEILSIIESDLDAYTAFYISLSKLSKQNQNFYQTRIAVNLIHESMSDYEGWLLFATDHDLIAIFKDVDSIIKLQTLIKQIREIFAGDQIAYLKNGEENKEFADIYEFPFNFQKFQDKLENKFLTLNLKTTQGSFNKTYNQIINITDLGELYRFEQAINQLDVNTVIKKQPICGILNDKKSIKILFHEVYISIARLERLTSTALGLAANSSLGKYLNNIINTAIINHLMKDCRILLGESFSLNMSCRFILSNSFKEFNKMIKTKIGVLPIILELDISEIFNDTSLYYKACEYARLEGYKICIDNLNEKILPLINKEQFKADFFKLSLIEDHLYNNNNKLQTIVNNFGGRNLIINNCDNQDILFLGKKSDIHIFQGWECDQLLKEKNSSALERVENW